MGVLRRVSDQSPRPLFEINPDVPEALEAVIERLHAKDPALRYQSAAEVAEVLGQQLVQLQRPGARLTRHAAVVSPQPLGAMPPAVKKAEPVDDWGPVKPRLRVEKFVVAALLVLLGLAVVGKAIGWEAVPLVAILLLLLGLTVVATAARFTSRGARAMGWDLMALLLLLGLAVVGTFAWFASSGPELPHFLPVTPAATAPAVVAAGFTEPPGAARQTVRALSGSTVIITNQAQGDLRTIVGSGKPVTKTWNLADFTAVEIRQPFRASVTRAGRFAVSVTADDNVIDHVEVAKEGARLRVGLENGPNYRLGPDPLKLAITLPVLEDIDLAGAAHATIQGFDSDRSLHALVHGASTLEGSIRAGDIRLDARGASSVTLSGSAHDARLLAHGASKLELADWQVKGEKLTIDVHGASSVRMRGAARAATLKAEGASHLHLSDLTLEAADVVLTGASDAKIRVKSLLNYDLSSASRLEYLGEPTIGKAKKSGASSVSHH